MTWTIHIDFEVAGFGELESGPVAVPCGGNG
jgi:hypothetical protein